MEHANPLIPSPEILAIQLGLFVACYFILRKLVFTPFLKLFHDREHQTTGAEEHAELDIKKALEFQAKYESAIKSERTDIQNWVNTEKSKLQVWKKEQLDLARREALEKYESGKRQIEGQKTTLRTELKPQIMEFAAAIIKKITGEHTDLSKLKSSESASR